MTQNRTSEPISTIDAAYHLLKRARTVLDGSEDAQLGHDIDRFMFQPIKADGNPFQVIILDPRTRNFAKALGIPAHRLQQMSREMGHAIDVDGQLEHMLAPNRPRMSFARILARSTQHSCSLAETVFMCWLLTTALEQITVDPIIMVRGVISRSLY